MVHPEILRIHDHSQSVVSDRQLNVLDSARAAGVYFFLLDRTRGVADVRFPAAEPFEPAAGPGNTNDDLAAAAFAEFLGDRFRDGKNRAGTVDLDEVSGQTRFGTNDQTHR